MSMKEGGNKLDWFIVYSPQRTLCRHVYVAWDKVEWMCPVFLKRCMLGKLGLEDRVIFDCIEPMKSIKKANIFNIATILRNLLISRVRHYLFWNLTRTLSLNSSISCLTFKLHKCFECKDLINVLFGKALKAKIYFVLKKSTEAIKQKSLDITDFFLMEMNWGLSTTTLFYLHFIEWLHHPFEIHVYI